MSLPRIKAPKATARPAAEATTYPELFLTTMVMRTASPQNQNLTLLFRNFNYDQMEFDPNEKHADRLEINDLYAEAARCPLVAQIMGLLVQGCHLLLQERTLLAAIAEDPENKAELEAELVTVHQGLGIEPQ